jgi:hypothetical protein
MDDEYTCVAADETAKVKIFYFNISPLAKYRIENITAGRKNSVYCQFANVEIGFTKNQNEYRTLSKGKLLPSGAAAYSTVLVGNFNDNQPKPVPEGAIQLFTAFWNVVAGDKCTINLAVRTL